MLFSLNYLNYNFSNIYFISKKRFKNYYQNPTLKYITLYVWVRQLDNYFVPEIVTSFCTLLYLTKKKPFIFKMGLFKEFRKTRNDLFIFIKFKNYKELSFVYSNFLIEILYRLSKFDYVVSLLLNKKKNLYIGHIQIQQFNGISFMETSSLFLYWRRCFIGMYVAFNCNNFKQSIHYLILLKLLFSI